MNKKMDVLEIILFKSALRALWIGFIILGAMIDWLKTNSSGKYIVKMIMIIKTSKVFNVKRWFFSEKFRNKKI